MNDSRIEELRRRIERDPASIAFAQLAEEYRRASRFQDAIDTCEAGLARHPGYLSARVTLGRSLVAVGQLDRAETELKQVLRSAPENLAAIRGLAEIHHRRGDLREALEQYQSALDLARNDPDLRHVVEQLGQEVLGGAPLPTVTPAAVASVSQPSAAVAAGRPAGTGQGTEAPHSASREEADERLARLLPVLQQWLDAVVANREQRQSHKP